MEMPKNYDNTVGITGDYETLEPGGYICKVVSAKEDKSKQGNRMLVIAFDIAEGEHKDIYKRRYEEDVKANTDPSKEVKWNNNGVHRIMIEDKDGNCNRFFKGFTTCIESSNNNYKFTGDEKTLKDKRFGGIFGEEEYERLDGSVGVSCKLTGVRSVQTIEDGKYRIPEIKKLANKGDSFEDFMNNVAANNSGDDLPF